MKSINQKQCGPGVRSIETTASIAGKRQRRGHFAARNIHVWNIKSETHDPSGTQSDGQQVLRREEDSIGQHSVLIAEAAGNIVGYGLILAAACLVAVTYFDLYTQMNAPHKVSIHLALLATMIAVLFELRGPLGISLPHVQAAVCGFAAFVGVTVGLSNTVGFLVGAYEDTTYLFCDLCCAALGIYFVARCVALATAAAPEKGEEETV